MVSRGLPPNRSMFLLPCYKSKPLFEIFWNTGIPGLDSHVPWLGRIRGDGLQRPFNARLIRDSQTPRQPGGPSGAVLVSVPCKDRVPNLSGNSDPLLRCHPLSSPFKPRPSRSAIASLSFDVNLAFIQCPSFASSNAKMMSTAIAVGGTLAKRFVERAPQDDHQELDATSLFLFIANMLLFLPALLIVSDAMPLPLCQ